MIRHNRLQVIKGFTGVHLRLTVIVCTKLHRHEAVKMRYVIWERREGILVMLDDPTYEELCKVSKETGTGFRDWEILESTCPECKEVKCLSRG